MLCLSRNDPLSRKLLKENIQPSASNKYHNRKVQLDGRTFASQKEANRYAEQIHNPELHPESSFVEDDIGFFKSLPLYHETEDYIFVHAGLNPDYPRPETSDRDTLLWIREDWLRCEYVGKLVVFGHTPARSVTWDARGGKIGIDTGAVRWGTLSCLELPTMRVYTASPQTFVQQKNKGKRAMLCRQVLALRQVTIRKGNSGY
ncbi:hypothetical protein CEB3_c05210 [Peptococcaceae bacterium CEB3]|nr:hypothetical protein CEB3_c05210 [Peptococcaceae bacterium CEB3]